MQLLSLCLLHDSVHAALESAFLGSTLVFEAHVKRGAWLQPSALFQPSSQVTRCILASRWEDGEKLSKTLEHLDRWELQAAESVQLEVAAVSLRFRQNQHLLSAEGAGVGAVLWESALVLAAHLGKVCRFALRHTLLYDWKPEFDAADEA